MLIQTTGCAVGIMWLSASTATRQAAWLEMAQKRVGEYSIVQGPQNNVP